jgi:hypothetical protein
MPRCGSLVLPLFVVCIILLCDFALIILQDQPYSTGPLIAIILYNLGVFMAIWSLFATMVSDPGFLPQGYRYDTTMMTRLSRQLYSFASEHQDVTIAVDKTATLSEYIIQRESTIFKLIIDAPDDFIKSSESRGTDVSLQFEGTRNDYNAGDDPFVSAETE